MNAWRPAPTSLWMALWSAWYYRDAVLGLNGPFSWICCHARTFPMFRHSLGSKKSVWSTCVWHLRNGTWWLWIWIFQEMSRNLAISELSTCTSLRTTLYPACLVAFGQWWGLVCWNWPKLENTIKNAGKTGPGYEMTNSGSAKDGQRTRPEGGQTL